MGRWSSVWLVLIVTGALVRVMTLHGAAWTTERPCADLSSLVIPDTAIVLAEDVPAGPFTPPNASRSLMVPAFCRVGAIATPTRDSRIAIEIWIPAANAWNGKLLGTGNGGFTGAVTYSAMVEGLARGYAVVGTDTGHAGDLLEVAQRHPEPIVDWAYRSIHVMTELAKLVIRDYRGRFPDRAYFQGCSTGGQQALSEAQRFPRDYDGIVAGDPGHNRVRLILGFLWSWMAMHHPDGRPIMPPAKLSLLTKAATAACDAGDGLKDGLIGDPRSCRFDPSVLLCRGAEDASCLTSEQVRAAKKVYDGAKNPRTGQSVFPGWARGSEQGWTTYLLNPAEPMRIGFFRYVAFNDPHWDWRTFDWDRDVAFVDGHLPWLSANARDLRAFRSNGGKLIMYTGLADPVVPPEDTVAYYEDVVKTMGGPRETAKFFRFFPVPGMGHCGGGPGPNSFDALSALERWSERDLAPDQITASHSTLGSIDRTRPLCAYPNVARFRGVGSIDAASSFSCAAAASPRPSRSSGH